MMTESEFRRESDTALETLNRQLGIIAENYDAEVMFQNGVLTIEVEEPNSGKIVVSPNAPVRQIWISALSTSFKLDWDAKAGTFVLARTGEALMALLDRLILERSEDKQRA